MRTSLTRLDRENAPGGTGESIFPSFPRFLLPSHYLYSIANCVICSPARLSREGLLVVLRFIFIVQIDGINKKYKKYALGELDV